MALSVKTFGGMSNKKCVIYWNLLLDFYLVPIQIHIQTVSWAHMLIGFVCLFYFEKGLTLNLFTLYVCVHMCACYSQRTWRSENNVLEISSPPTFWWVLGVELRLLGSTESTFTTKPSC